MMQQFTESTWPKERWPNFSFREMACKHTGLCYINTDFMDTLQRLRRHLGFSLNVTSGFRHSTHPVEAKKESGPGTHSRGVAVDIAISGAHAFGLIGAALERGFMGIGIHQRGAHNERFVHIDTYTVNRPAVWTY